MSTPPRIRGLVDRLEMAVKLYCYAKGSDKPFRKQEITTAKLELIRTFAILGAKP